MDELERLFLEWIERVSQSSPPPSDIAALNFGLFQSDSGYKVYLTGARIYDPTNDDWACEEDYTPKERYFELPNEFDELKSWQEIEQSVVDTIANIKKCSASGNILKKIAVVTVGFDEGNLRRVE